MNLLDLLYIPLAALAAPLWAGKRRHGWKSRFGHVEAMPPPAANRPRIMLHAVSVGEVNALRPLVPLLTPHAEVVVSTTTDTGLARAQALFASTCTVVRYPLDFSWAVTRFLDAIRPNVVGLVELEVWPNFVAISHKRGILIGLINGRLSERSFRGYRKIRTLFAPSLRRLAFAAVQEQAYADRLIALGANPQLVQIDGSMKWDSATPVIPLDTPASQIPTPAPVPGALELAQLLRIDLSRPLIVAGSTGPGEEALLHQATPPGVQLLCAPRKPERFSEAAAALPDCIRRSQVAQNNGVASTSDRFLLDSIGELKQAYALATLAVVGRSFYKQYGSDPIEPIGLGRCTLIGPAHADFGAIVGAFGRAGGIVVTDAQQLPRVLTELMNDPARRATIAHAGLCAIRAEQGAARRHARLLLGQAGVKVGPREAVGA